MFNAEPGASTASVPLPPSDTDATPDSIRLTAASTPPSGSKPNRLGLPLDWLILMGLLAVAHLPLLVLQAQSLWAKPHYQFFPVALVGVMWFIYQRWPGLDACIPGNRWVSRLMFSVAYALLLVAAVLVSPWLGSVAALLTLTALTFSLGGASLLRRMLPVGLVLLLLIPPPLDLDQRVVGLLQTLASYGTSNVLDYVGILHIRSGNVIEVVGQRLFVEEACSGIRSFFSVMVYVSFFLIWVQAGWLRSVYLLLAAVVWVLLANLTRIIAIAYALNRWGIDLTFGWRHETVGYVLFLFILAGLWCMDQFWLYCTTVTAVAVPESAAAQRRKRRGSSRRRAAQTAAQLEVEENGSAAAPAQEEAAEMEETPVPEPAPAPAEVVRERPRRRSGPFPKASWTLDVAYLCLAAFQLVWMSTIMVGTTHDRSRIHELLDAQTAEAMPPELFGWKRGNFEVIDRDTGNFYGEHSHQWTYTTGTLRGTVSFDYPFAGWHELPLCYRSAGWDDEEMQPVEVQGERFYSVHLRKPLDHHGYLWFNVFESDGRPVGRSRPAADNWEKKAGRRFLNVVQQVQQSFDRILGRQQVVTPGFQFQLLLESYRPLTETELAQAQAWFKQASALARKPFRADSEPQP
jgi:exosortase